MEQSINYYDLFMKYKILYETSLSKVNYLQE